MIWTLLYWFDGLSLLLILGFKLLPRLQRKWSKKFPRPAVQTVQVTPVATPVAPAPVPASLATLATPARPTRKSPKRSAPAVPPAPPPVTAATIPPPAPPVTPAQPAPTIPTPQVQLWGAARNVVGGQLTRRIAAALAIILLVWWIKSSNAPTPQMHEEKPSTTSTVVAKVKSTKAPKPEGCEVDPAADPIAVTVTTEWSDLYCMPTSKMVDIRAYNQDASYDLDVQDGSAEGVYRFTDGKIYQLDPDTDEVVDEVESVEGSIFEFRLRAVKDPEKVRIKILEP